MFRIRIFFKILSGRCMSLWMVNIVEIRGVLEERMIGIYNNNLYSIILLKPCKSNIHLSWDPKEPPGSVGPCLLVTPASCPPTSLRLWLTSAITNQPNLNLNLIPDMHLKGLVTTPLHLETIDISCCLNIRPRHGTWKMIRLIMLLLFRCYSKEKSGYKYYSNVVRDVVTVDTLSQCAGRCDREVFCNSFSFRYPIVLSSISSISPL